MLNDFRLSRKGVDEKHIAKSFCRSIEYLTPELLSRGGHGKAIYTTLFFKQSRANI